jgi:ribose transport system ATP-binding protein
MGFEVRSLTKSYAGVTVLEQVDLAVADGEIHALVGANGAGKSTLIKCVGGAIVPDGGEIVLGNDVHASLTPKEAREAGVAVIYQDFSLAPSLTVTENVFLGRELRRGPFTRRGAQRQRTKELLTSLAADEVTPDATVEDLRGAGQQIVEIAKALEREPTILILDEPTASLTEKEAALLAEQLRTLKRHRLPILYVTHRLDEVFAIADRATVLRDGRSVLTADVARLSRQDIVDAIVGQAGPSVEAVKSDDPGGEANESMLLEVDGLVAPGIGPINFELRQGEILGVFGQLGSGRTELLEAILGVRALENGVIKLDSKAVRFRRPSDAIAAGIALVPSERRRKSLFMPLSSLDNVLLPSFPALGTGPLRSRRRERTVFAGLAERLYLRPARYDMEAQRFSGGNQQKLSIGRWLGPRESLRVLMLDEPTQGVDVAARAELYATLKNTVMGSDRGVLVTSSDTEELVLLADRVLVLSRGRLAVELKRREITERRLIEAAHMGEEQVA